MEDVAAAFETILVKGRVGETYNIGTQKERTVLDVAHDIAAIFNLPADNITHVRDRAFNDQRCAPPPRPAVRHSSLWAACAPGGSGHTAL